MSPIFIIAMVIVWLVISQAKKAARQGMSAGARAAGRNVRDRVRGRIESYRDVVRSQGEDVERQLEQAAGELEDRWSRAEQMLGPQESAAGDAETWASDTAADESGSTWEDEVPRVDAGDSGDSGEAPAPLVPEPEALHKLTPHEARTAKRTAALAAAATATAAAAAAELARAEAELVPPPSDGELAGTVEEDLSIHALEKDLFESSRPGFEIEERFRDEFRGRRVRWSGLLDRAEASLSSDRIEVFVHEIDEDPVSRPLSWAFELDPRAAEGLVGQRELPVTIEGTLDGCDPYLRQVRLAHARRTAE